MDLRCKQTVGRRRDGRGNRGRRTRRGTGATPLEERVRRLEKDVEELREQVRTHAQAQTQVRAIAETQNGARVETPKETPGEAATPTQERPAQREIASPFAEATRKAVRHRGGNARERGPLLGLFPDGLPPATWWVARAGVVLLLVGVSFLLRMGVEQGWLTPAVRVTGGLVIGVALSAFGLRARLSRPAYSQLLGGGGASERGVARAVRRRGRLRDAVHAALTLLQRTSPGRLLSAAARWLFDGLRLQRVASGVRHCHHRHMGDSRRVRPRRAHPYHLYRGRTAPRPRVVGIHRSAYRLVDDTLPQQRPPLPARERGGKRYGKCFFGE